MQLELADRVVAVTGGARGLGQAIAHAFLSEGARVLTVDRSFPEDAPVAEDSGRHRRCVLDVASEAGARAVAGAAVAAFGGIDILVCNAGRHSSEAVTAVTATELTGTFATNLGGALFAIQEAARLGLENGAVAIIGSTATRSVQAGELSYRASKLALRALAESAALELCSRGTRVNLITPGAIATGFAPPGDRRQAVIAEIPMRREAAPAEIARTVVFLCSSAASYITGAELLVDGGLSLRPLPGHWP